MSSALVALSTHNDLEAAKRLSHLLVEEKLVACVSLLPKITSIYRWKGEVCEDAECMMIMKTWDDKRDALEAFFLKRHAYETPELVFLPAQGAPTYLDWVKGSTR